MSGPACPRCQTAFTGSATLGAWVTCANCHYRWLPPPEEIRRLRNGGSDEYLPDEPGTEARKHAPAALTQRVEPDGRPTMAKASASDRQRIAQPVPAPRPPPPGPRSEPALPASTTTLDSGLFDRLEEEAQANRSHLRTLPEISFGPQGEADVQPHSDHSSKTACPVCGHSFNPGGSGDHRHRCPQCQTAFDDTSGRLSPSDPGSRDPLIGQTLRGCLIDRKLGEGGMGSVYHAKQLSLDREVAIKVLPPELARNKNFIQRFEREAKSLARINHANILHIYDFGDDPELNLYFMIIEFVDGLDLGEVINRRGVLGEVETLDLLRQALTGLEQAAEKGVVHRDIKPDNLMVDREGGIKVSDFGLAKAESANTGVTAVGVRVGTPAFMSPEQCDGIEVDFRSDVYNLGATGYLCLTGRLPFDGETPFAIMLKHKTELVTPLREVDPSLDRDVDRLICRMLAKRPEDRCGSLRALVEDIEALEIRLAGTDSILRRSQGPFRALVNPQTVAGTGTCADENGVSARRRAAEAQAAKIEVAEPAPAPSAELFRLVEDQAVQRPPTLPATSAPAPAEPPRRGISGRNSSLLPGAMAVSGSRPGSRRLEVELDRARARGRRSEVNAIAANGDRLAAQGALSAAAAEWDRACLMTQAEDEIAELRSKARAARRRQRLRTLVRTVVWTVLPAAFVGCVVFAATPYAHGLVANVRLNALLDAPAPDRRVQVAALRTLASTESEPWAWYVATFRRGYGVPAADRALVIALELERRPAPTPRVVIPPAPATSDLLALERLAADPTVPWSAVVLRADALVKAGAGARASAISQQAATFLAAARAAAAAIATERTAGRHAAALERAAAFPAAHPRCDEVELPLPGRILVDAAGNQTPDLRILVDGVALTGTETDRRFCRDPRREVVIEVTATGYLPARIHIPSGGESSERRSIALLRLAPRWSRQLTAAMSSPWGVRLALVGDRVAALHRDGCILFRAADGAALAQTDRVPGGPGFANLWQVRGDRIVTGSDDGLIQLLDPATLATDLVLMRGRQEVQAWLEFEMTYQSGRRLGIAVTDVAGAKQVVAADAGREIWRYSQVKGQQPAWLSRHDDRLLVIDDSRLHLIEEDGSGAQPIALPAPRIGPVVECRALGALLVPTTTGVFAIRLGNRQDPVRLLADKALAAAGPGLVGVADDQVMIAGLDREAHLLSVVRGSLEPRWKHSGDRQFSAPPVLADGFAITVDELVTVFRRNDGQVLRRIATGAPPAGQPLVIGHQVIIADRAGTVAAYSLVER